MFVENLWISLAIATFAVYRLSRMIGLEEGPFEVFLTFRSWMYSKFEYRWVRNGVVCPLCISFWISLPAALLVTYQLHLDWYAVFWLWISLSGAASFLYKLEQG